MIVAAPRWSIDACVRSAACASHRRITVGDSAWLGAVPSARLPVLDATAGNQWRLTPKPPLPVARLHQPPVSPESEIVQLLTEMALRCQKTRIA